MTTSGSSRTDVVITATELLAELTAGHKLVLLDVRRLPQRPSQRPEYERGHIPGAFFVEFAERLAGPKQGFSGNSPLPGPEALQHDVRRWGIDSDSLVVVYGDGSPSAAARGWLVLKWAGVPHVKYLDGGLRAWVAAGGQLSTEEPAEGNGTFTVVAGSLATLTADEAETLARKGTLLDARGAKQYQGGPSEPGQPPQGHIPGAISAPASDDLDDDLLRSDEQIRSRFEAIGVIPGAEVGTYCGGGVAASLQALVLASVGITAPVFIGSWSAWSSDPARPVATGPSPG